MLPQELTLLVQRLSGLASDCGVTDLEVELLLHLPSGGWDRLRSGIGPAPDERRERRLRHLLDLLVLAKDIGGSVEEVAEWLRGDRRRGLPVLVHLLEAEGHLAWLRGELMRQHRLRFPGSGW